MRAPTTSACKAIGNVMGEKLPAWMTVLVEEEHEDEGQTIGNY